MSVKEARRFFRYELSKMDIPVTLIGEITAKNDGYKMIGEDGKEMKLSSKGYLHF